MLEARDVTVAFDGVPAVDGAWASVAPGEIVVIAGPNGAGKSTLLSVMSGVLPASLGSALLDGKDIETFSPDALAERRAVLEQTPVKDLPFTISALISLAMPRAVTPENARAIEAEALAAMQLSDQAGKPVMALSGGQAHRAHLARVYAQCLAGRSLGHGRYLLIDEPTASLDLKHQASVMRLARSVADRGCGVLMILHDLTLTAAIADRVVLMDKGRIAAEGAAQEVLTAEMLSKIYDIPVTTTRVAGQLAVVPHVFTQP